MAETMGFIPLGAMCCLMSLERQRDNKIVLPTNWGLTNWMDIEFVNARGCEFIPDYEFNALNQGLSDFPYPNEEVHVWILWSTGSHQSFIFLTHNPSQFEAEPFFMIVNGDPKKCFEWQGYNWIPWIKKVHKGTYVVSEVYIP
jgi:hypothetical protein